VAVNTENLSTGFYVYKINKQLLVVMEFVQERLKNS